MGGVGASAVVLVHDEVPGRGSAEVGTVGPALTELGFDVAVTAFLPGAPPIPDPTTIDLVVVLGSATAAYDDTVPWLAAELAYVTRAIELDKPVLGICFGGQLLARALGGTVARAARPERGFVSLASADERALPSGGWLEFHDDTFTLPPGAELLAGNESGAQAFRLGRHLALQFHPEVTPAVFQAWIDSWRATGELDDVRSSADLPALLDEIAARSVASVAACRTLVHRFCALA
jgi:GMP synthase (glutamine-hydrolysing)